MKKLFLLMPPMIMLTACSEAEVSAPSQLSQPAVVAAVKRNQDSAQLMRGAGLFQKNCATCHGEQAQGAPNWHQQGADGKLPPPPLDGTGHTWHHPTAALKYTIKNGTEKIGGNMPGFASKLSESEIEDILAFLQAKWPDPLYEAWRKTDERVRNAGLKQEK